MGICEGIRCATERNVGGLYLLVTVLRGSVVSLGMVYDCEMYFEEQGCEDWYMKIWELILMIYRVIFSKHKILPPTDLELWIWVSSSYSDLSCRS